MDGMIIQHVRLGAIGCLADRSNSLVKILGIPYGTIDQRFARSKLSKDLSTQRGRYRNDIFDATNPGASSIQPWGSVKSDASNIPLPTDDLPEDEEQSEDCLNLSLYIPTSCFDNGNTIKTNEKLPVLVFLHGGAYFLGSANRPYYSPVGLMRHGIDRNSPFIFISINYRLGGLGFYHCPGAPDLVPPNNGLHDQLLALQWLRENLEGFGGDLDRVTIIGQSAGGESISLHAASGLQPPLYKRAIMLSGSPVTMPAKTPQEYGEIFYQEAEKMGIRVKDGETWRSAQEVAQAMIEIDVDEIRKAGFVGLPCTNTEMLPYERPIMEMMMTGDQAKKGWVEAAIVGSATYDGGISFDMIYRDKNRRDHARGFIKIAEEVLGPENAQELCDIYHLGHDTEDNEALKKHLLVRKRHWLFRSRV
jgi:carboxylesterase type B